MAKLSRWTEGRSFAALVGILERFDREPDDLLRVLTYHRVEWSGADPAPDPALTVEPDIFASQMQYVRAHCHAVSVAEVLAALRGERQLPRRAVLVTFDDGYRDFRSRAWPILAAHQIPVALFVPTAFPGDPARVFWWECLRQAVTQTPRRDALVTEIGSVSLATAPDRDAAYARLRVHAKRLPHVDALRWVTAICRDLDVPAAPPAILSWDELRELANLGVTIGSHTRTHPLLTRIPIAEARVELRGALDDLARELGSAQPLIAYPAGAFDDAVVRAAADVGYRLGFTTVRGVNPLAKAQPLTLRRINVGRRTNIALLRLQLAGRASSLNRFHPLLYSQA